MKESIKETVKAGAAWMDANHPGWETQIDLSGLAMYSCSSCIIGQAVGEYYDTIAMAAGDDCYDETVWAIDHGFQAPDFEPESEEQWEDYVAMDKAAEKFYNEYYRNLDDLWTDEVKDRFNRGGI